MTKYTLDTNKTTLRVKEGRKVVAKIPTTLTPHALDGLIAGADTAEEDLDKLVAVLTAAVEEAQKRKGSVVPYDYRIRYGADQNCGDTIAQKLTDKVTTPEGVDLKAAEEIASQNGVSDKFDAWMAKGLNPGMVRMNLGNVLRGKARRGEEVVGL